ncbi:lipoyl synthase, partial [Bacillus atrophaeus]|nr:lipoyl synthase [Bacillus atrophaeus]
KEMQPDIPTKSSIMIGLGETKEEIIEVMDDLLANNVDIMAIGQYLQPSKKHLKVQKYYHPDEFAELKEIAMQKGFSHCEAGPLVRSSYHADEQVNEASKKRQAQA